MFLYMLTDEEKQQYLNLAVIAVHINGALEDEEKKFIEGYQREMEISVGPTLFDSIPDEESVFYFFSSSEKSHKRIVLFELIGLLTCDRVFDEEEKNFILRLCSALGLSADEIDSISQLALRYFDIITEIASSIFIP